MKVAEIFYSIQGEGLLLGVPSVFVRTSGCNLRCRWCDTPYTSWQPEGSFYSIAEILSAVRSYGSTHVVLTGGEPMIAPEIAELAEGLRGDGYHITIETAGTVYGQLPCDLMSISPKLQNSTPEGDWARQHERLRRNPEVLLRLLAEYPYQLKFVISDPSDIKEVQQIVEEALAAKDRVLLMPEGRDPSSLREKGLWLVEVCKQTGYRYCPRAHVDLWGDKRGV